MVKLNNHKYGGCSRLAGNLPHERGWIPLPCQDAPLLRISASNMLIIIHQGSRHDAGLRAQQVGNQSG